MVMVERECGHDAGAQLVALGVGEFEGADLLEMVVQQPGVINHSEQDQRLPAGDRRALAAHVGARAKLGASRLEGAGLQAGYNDSLPAQGWTPAAKAVAAG